MKESDKVEIFKKLIGFKSINGHELPVAQYLHSLFEDAGIASQVLPLPEDDRANLVAEIGSGKPILAISGHMDVVDVSLENWNTDPFVLTAQGDRFYGRGATDMKAGLAAMVIALIELKQEQVPIPGTIRFLATAGEEVGQAGAQALQQAGYMKDVDTLLIGEPSGFRAVYANKGEINFNIQVTGRAAHSSMPALGINAVENLLKFLYELNDTLRPLVAQKSNPLLGETVVNIDQINGGTQPNAIPGSAQAVLNVRIIPEFDNQQIKQVVADLVDQFNQQNQAQVKVTTDMDIIPILGRVYSKIIKLIQQVALPYLQKQDYNAAEIQQMQKMADASGIDFATDHIVTVGVSGGTDASQLLIDHPNDANYVVFGPGNDNSHQDNEYITQQMFFDFIEIYHELFIKFFQ